VAGDTMTGDLTIENATPIIYFKDVAGVGTYFSAQFNGLARWEMSFGAFTGYGFSLNRYNDAGGSLGAALTIDRATGDTKILGATASTTSTSGALTVAGGVGVGGNLFAAGTMNSTLSATIGGNLYVGVGAASSIAVTVGPGGSGVTSTSLLLNTSSNTATAATINYQRNGTTHWIEGQGNGGGDNWAVYHATSPAGFALTALATDFSVSMSSTTASTSATTGALKVAGGVGVAGAIWGGTTLDIAGVAKVASGTAIPAGGSTSARILFSTASALGIYFGSGAPTVSAAQGSIYIRSDGAVNARLYINTNSSTTWTAFNTTT